VLIAIIKQRLGLKQSLYTILQILSLSLFERTPISCVFQRYDDETNFNENSKQLTLLDIYRDDDCFDNAAVADVVDGSIGVA